MGKYGEEFLANVELYSSHQLVFGQNPKLPNIVSDNLPA